jgi:hypothetical protein
MRAGRILIVLCIARLPALAVNAKLLNAKDYKRHIDALIRVHDFGTQYFEDGAADATVVAPEKTAPPYGQTPPVEAVADLLRLGHGGLSLLIDCLSDGRITSMRFAGNTITKPMNVPVGYVCLDILMTEVKGRPAIDPECSSDGLGACVNDGFYFRPDDYFDCSDRSCYPRPWVNVVQRNWRHAYLSNLLHVRNPSVFLKPE